MRMNTGSKHHAQASHKRCNLTLFAVVEFAVVLGKCLKTPSYPSGYGERSIFEIQGKS